MPVRRRMPQRQFRPLNVWINLAMRLRRRRSAHPNGVRWTSLGCVAHSPYGCLQLRSYLLLPFDWNIRSDARGEIGGVFIAEFFPQLTRELHEAQIFLVL